ncbi:MAG: hypothetical protein A2Y25_06305 [Candidatus Melainabacteria bacterium GWF2_37_15]|nr:MAG: hypothetical protein A2Y25_06305 [Candidatus Melainabacteria bacterium GWF2_37_15]
MHVNNYNKIPVAFRGNLIDDRKISGRFKEDGSLIGHVVKLDKITIENLSKSNVTGNDAFVRDKVLSLCADPKGAVVVEEMQTNIPELPDELNRLVTVAKFFTSDEKIKTYGIKEEETEDNIYKPGVVKERIPIAFLDWIREATKEEMEMVEFNPEEPNSNENLN